MGRASASGGPKEWRKNSGQPGPKDPGIHQEPALVVNICIPWKPGCSEQAPGS